MREGASNLISFKFCIDIVCCFSSLTDDDRLETYMLTLVKASVNIQ